MVENWLVNELLVEGNIGSVGAPMRDGSEDATGVLMVPVTTDSTGEEMEGATDELVAWTRRLLLGRSKGQAAGWAAAFQANWGKTEAPTCCLARSDSAIRWFTMGLVVTMGSAIRLVASEILTCLISDVETEGWRVDLAAVRRVKASVRSLWGVNNSSSWGVNSSTGEESLSTWLSSVCCSLVVLSSLSWSCEAVDTPLVWQKENWDYVKEELIHQLFTCLLLCTLKNLSLRWEGVSTWLNCMPTLNEENMGMCEKINLHNRNWLCGKHLNLSFLRHFAKRHPGQWSWTLASTGQLDPRLQRGGRFLSGTRLPAHIIHSKHGSWNPLTKTRVDQ